MGDRVIVTFTDDGTSFTPGIYMHWQGYAAKELIRDFQQHFRRGDAFYSAARFCGECHKHIPGVTGLGLVNAPEPFQPNGLIDWEAYSPGDAGVFAVNVTTGEVQRHDSEEPGFQLDPANFGRG